MIGICPQCSRLFETTTEMACSPNRDDRLCLGCWDREHPDAPAAIARKQKALREATR